MRKLGRKKGLYSRGDTGSVGLVAGCVGGEGRKDRGRNWTDELGRDDMQLTDWTVLTDVRWVRESHAQRKRR